MTSGPQGTHKGSLPDSSAAQQGHTAQGDRRLGSLGNMDTLRMLSRPRKSITCGRRHGTEHQTACQTAALGATLVAS